MKKQGSSKTCFHKAAQHVLTLALLLALPMLCTPDCPAASQDLPGISLACPHGTVRPATPFDVRIAVTWKGEADSHVIVPPEPVFPESFSLRSSAFEATVAGSMHRMIYRFTLSAREPGRFEIAPVLVRCWPRARSGEVSLRTDACTITVAEPGLPLAACAAGAAALGGACIACAVLVLRKRSAARRASLPHPDMDASVLAEPCRAARLRGDYASFYTAARTAARILLPDDRALQERIAAGLDQARFSTHIPSAGDADDVLRRIEAALDRAGRL